MSCGRVSLQVGLLLVAWLAGGAADAATRVKADNTTALNSTNSWAGFVVPTGVDIARWDNTITNAGSASLGVNLTWGQIQFVDPGTGFSVNAGGILTLNGVGGVGIDMSAATTDLTFNCSTLINFPQEWNIAEGRRVSVNDPRNGGTNTLYKTGAGTLVFAGTGGNDNLQGLVVVREGTLELNKGAGNTTAINSGGLVVGVTNLLTPPPALVRMTGASFNLVGNSYVVINKSGVLDSMGHTEDIGGAVVLVGTNDMRGTITNSVGGGRLTCGASLNFVGGGHAYMGTGSLQLNGDLTYTPALDGQMALIDGGVNLNGSPRSFAVTNDPALEVELQVTGNVTNGDIVKASSGTMFLSGTNTYSGPTTINAGALRISQTTGLGAQSPGTTVNSGGALELADGVSNVPEILTLSGQGVGGGGALRSVSGDNSFMGSLTLLSAVRINADAGTLTLGGSAINSSQNLLFGGAGNIVVTRALNLNNDSGFGVTKDGTGTLTLVASNGYGGATTVTGGTLRVEGRLNLSRVRVSDGGTLGGSGTIVRSVTNAAGGTLAPGSSVGTLIVGQLALEAGSSLAYEFQNVPPANDQAVTTNGNSLTINGGAFSLYEAGTTNVWTPAVGEGTFNLIRYVGAIGGTGVSALSVTNAHPAWSYSFDADGTWVRLHVLNNDFPAITNTAATSITMNSASLNGTLLSTGAADTVVSVYWGTQDRTNDAAGWEHSYTYLAPSAPGAHSHVATGLLPETAYYYRFAASNAQGMAWASPSVRFETSFDPAQYAHKMRIMFTGYTNDEVLVNFPALVVFSPALSNGFDYADFASPNGYDLRFRDDTETVRLNHEIESWNATSNSHIWVQVPDFTNSCAIWAYWGNTNALTPAAYTTNGSTWDAHFKGVWHLSAQTPAQHFPDSTANGRTATNVTPAGVVQAEAIVGRGQTLNGTSGWLDANAVGVSGNMARTLSGWAQYINTGNSYPTLFGSINTAGDTANTEFYVSHDFAPNMVLVRGGGGLQGIDNFGPENFNWAHYVATWDGTTITLFLNGVQVTANGGHPAQTTIDRFVMGNQRRFNSYVNCRLDEVRIEDTARSPNWIRASYLNQLQGQGFATYGAATQTPPSGFFMVIW